MFEFSSIDNLLCYAGKYEKDFKTHGKILILSSVEKIKSSSHFLFLKARDKSGTISARRFLNRLVKRSELEHIKEKYKPGQVLEIEGKINDWGLSISNERVLNNSDYNIEDFLDPSEIQPIDIESLKDFLFQVIESIQNVWLKEVLTWMFYVDENYAEKFFNCPASEGIHHSSLGGLLAHTVGMLRTFIEKENYYNKNTNINRDLVLTGICVHDCGKTEEYIIINNVIERTKQGSLIGHFHLGAEIVNGYIKNIINFPIELKNDLIHIILSHHGTKDYGAVIEPKTPEAELIYHLDAFDAKFNTSKDFLQTQL